MIGVSVSSSYFCRSALALLLISVCCGPNRVHAADQKPGAPTAKTQQRLQQLKKLEDEKELLRLFADTLEQVKTRYVEADVSERELIEAAIQGMVSRLDPYSHYIAPKDLDRFRKGLDHEFIGIGIQVSEREGHLLITSPLFDTPAWRAGLRAGDKILKINDTSTRGLSIDAAVKLMSGAIGSEVSITVSHPGDRVAETVKLKRERILQPTVIGYHRDAQGVWDFYCDHEHQIGYVRITAFSGNTASDLQRVLKTLLGEGMRGLVVDLRFNPGGMLKQAIQVCDLFLRKGRIVSIEGRATRNEAWEATSEGTLIPVGFPVVVLVNRFSASAAEIVSACLQDNHAATIIGERTWGKGSVQNVIVLDDGKSALKLTTAGYHRPSGKNIHREVEASESDQWGVHPDKGFVIKLKREEMRDLDALLARQDELTQIRHRALSQGQPKSAKGYDAKPKESHFVDRQLKKALETIRTKIDASANKKQTDAATEVPKVEPREPVPAGAKDGKEELQQGKTQRPAGAPR